MASSNKPTGLHFSLIILSLITVGLLIYGVMNHRWRTEAEAQALAAKNEASAASSSLNTQVQEMQAAMNLIGAGQPTWTDTQASVQTAIQTLGVNQEKQTVVATLEALRSTLDSTNAENETLKQDLEAAKTEMLGLRENYQGNVDQHDQSQQESEALVQKMRAEMDEQLQQRDQQLTQNQEQLRREQVEKEQLRDQLNKTERDLGAQIKDLSLIVESQRARLEEVLKTSFEVADGAIVSVDANLNSVYINLGEQDNLRPQVSFSVYDRTNRGIGREARDIKARIEVRRILGPHLAEATVLEQDRTRPIADGDPIYSPIWAGGRTEYFAVVGLVDFDNDGQSDRSTLHRVVKNAGAEIDLEIDDNGVRQPENAKITSSTKFLVLGQIPAVESFATGDERRNAAQKMMEQRNALLSEAQAAGVRPVSLSDFLAYIGYKPQQRYFSPGNVDQYNLETGARKPSVRQDVPGGQTLRLEDMRKREAEAGSYRN